MKPRGIKQIVQTHLGTVALCKDGTAWIARTIEITGKTNWVRVTDIPKQD